MIEFKLEQIAPIFELASTALSIYHHRTMVNAATTLVIAPMGATMSSPCNDDGLQLRQAAYQFLLNEFQKILQVSQSK